MIPRDGSWLAFALWLVGIGAVAFLWEQIEERILEWQWRRRERRKVRAFTEWYRAHPCKRAELEPWRDGAERRTNKLGRL